MSVALISPDVSRVKMSVVGICRRCKHYHTVEGLTPDLFGRAAFDWEHKHRQCELEQPGSIEFLSPKRVFPKNFDDRIYEAAGEGPQWLDWKPNANANITYVADAAFTLTLSALASSSTWTAGRESTAITNSSNYLDYSISGTFISGTTPTAPAEARLYYVRAYEDTPTWGGGIAGTGDAAATITNTNILDSMVLGWSGTASTSSNVTYPIQSALTLVQAFGIVPKNFLIFFAHAHTAALKTDANNNNSIFYQATYVTIA